MGDWTRRWLAVTAAALAASVLAGACGGGSEESKVEATLRRAVEAYNDGDVEAFLALHTDQALEDEYGLPRDLAIERLAEFIGQPPIELRSLSNATVDGNSATIEYERTQGRVVVREQVSLVKREDWMLDGFEDRPVDIPADAVAIGVEMAEFTFAVDASGVRDGNVALTVSNTGQQDHEAVVARIADGADLQVIVESIAKSPGGETPAGLEEIVAFGAFEPGEARNVVFAEPLEPGRYAVLCFFPDVTDPEHTPHALKGMFAEFRIPA